MNRLGTSERARIIAALVEGIGETAGLAFDSLWIAENSARLLYTVTKLNGVLRCQSGQLPDLGCSQILSKKCTQMEGKSPNRAIVSQL